ncbi:MAG: tRNA(5-methylaminomethyl-2-thiouridylate) methyltransferase [Thermodesulfobacteriota bacterium]
MAETYHCLSLFSAGLDSILAARVLMAQGLKVKCLHFVSPFFGDPRRIPHWERVWGLDISPVDVSAEFTAMLRGPAHGFGKLLNPCMDCKILMLSGARELMSKYGATFLATGEVVGQRPMSQRRDAMNAIARDAGVKGILLRPLCARKLDPTPMEESGLVDRERLHDFGGRGRRRQLDLAREFGLAELPTPAGGCLLAEPESARRFWPLLKHVAAPGPELFRLADEGRQYWAEAEGAQFWLAIGRNQAGNERLERLLAPGDLVFKTRDFPGPLAVGRPLSGPWPDVVIADAAAFFASYSPKAARSGGPVAVSVTAVGAETRTVEATPCRATPLAWAEPQWDDEAKARNLQHCRGGAE